jgi:glycosyltransferase involved in cell wall biosynthesis
VVANSNAGLRAFGFDQDRRGHVVYNGFDKTRLLGLDVVRSTEGPTRVVMAARMEPEKDFPLLLHAASILGQTEPGRWRFVLVGAGPERQKLLSRARSIRGCSLEFPEMGLEVLPAVASADIGVLLTTPKLLAEGCSNSIMEYMALGLPVVCSDSGGNREIVEHGITGFVIPPADVDALVAALRSLGSDAGLRASLGNAGRQSADSRFSVERFAEDFLTIYRGVCVDPRRSYRTRRLGYRRRRTDRV